MLRRLESLAGNRVVVVVLTVDQEVVAARTSAVDGEIDAVAEAITVGILYAGKRQREFGGIQRILRQIQGLR